MMVVNYSEGKTSILYYTSYSKSERISHAYKIPKDKIVLLILYLLLSTVSGTRLLLKKSFLNEWINVLSIQIYIFDVSPISCNEFI